MRPRIKTTPKLVASTSNDTTIQDLCAYNRRTHKQAPKIIKSYILMCFGMKKTITKSEYDYYISQGLTNLVKIEYA
jgi:mannose-1-phosphate guanylyltransferase